MSESLDRLIYMANQIARNLATHADPGAAVADHIARFWDPRMKSLIFAHASEGGEGLSPVAAVAVRRLAERGAPASQSEATRFGYADGSDAG